MSHSIDIHKKKLKKVLVNFSQPPNSLESGIFGHFYKHNVSAHYELWRLIRFLFDDILNFQIADQPVEKVNWEIPFVYLGKYSCSIAHQKFGFRVYVKNSKKAVKIAKEIVSVLNSALKNAEPLIKDFAEEALSKGEISVENMVKRLTEPYEYFKSQATMLKARVAPISTLSLKKPMPSDWQELFQSMKEVDYLEHAGYISFFSLLEHLCVLILAFRNLPERKNVRDFASKKWQEKYKTVFDLRDKNFKDNFDYLVGLAKYKRNPGAHGFTDKTHTNFYFYLKGARHRIPVSLYGHEIIAGWQNFTLNFKKLDNFLKLLHEHNSTRRIMAYLDTSLNVSFGTYSAYDELLKCSDDEFEFRLRYLVDQSDNLTNMDW